MSVLPIITLGDPRLRLKGEPVWQDLAPLTQRSNDTLQARVTMPQARLWSPAGPSLYEVEVSLPGKNGDTVQAVTGFRSLEAFGQEFRLNGKPLGYSENLFTPVEWEITDQARIGEKNRLDLEMKVDTVSEMLSYSSGYAFHNLGGIDRSVSVFALPAALEAAYAPANPAGAHETKSYQGTFGYSGPCPPALHVYEFVLYALDVATLPGVMQDVSLADAQTAIKAHSLGSTKLTAMYMK